MFVEVMKYTALYNVADDNTVDINVDHNILKCGFPLAEERKKRKTFSSHTAGSLGTGVRGISGHVARVKFQFLFCHPPFPDMPHPPIREVPVECVQLR